MTLEEGGVHVCLYSSLIGLCLDGEVGWRLSYLEFEEHSRTLCTNLKGEERGLFILLLKWIAQEVPVLSFYMHSTTCAAWVNGEFYWRNATFLYNHCLHYTSSLIPICSSQTNPAVT